ncbi:MAG: LysR family transcriptional regulator [Oscillospiraceae bacterium]|nr:LysR family transcriptional regulator [Oscillospiraceae bacterium]
MTVNQLNCFEAVCRTMSFSKAANMLYISQPAISKSISKLERELGAELFEQVNSTLVLTAAGEIFRDFVKVVRDEHTLLRERMERLSSMEGKTIRLGCPETWDPTYFAQELEKCFASVNPGCRLCIEAYTLSDMLLRLQSGKLDMIISHDFYTPAMAGIHSETLTETGVGVLYSKARFGGGVGFDRLAAAGFLVYDRDIEKRFGAVIQGICADHGVSTRITDMGQIAKALFEVSRGGGVMLFTDWDNAVGNSSFGYYPLEKTLPVNLTFFPERLSTPASRFLQAAKSLPWQ